MRFRTLTLTVEQCYHIPGGERSQKEGIMDSETRPVDPSSVLFFPDICYGTADGIALFLDILRPAMPSREALPVVMHIHGGGWYTGDKRWVAQGQQLVRPNLLFASHGFFTISVNYRLSHQACFPAQLEDVKAAVRWVRAQASHYHLDAEHIGVWGNSAGGHLAALLGFTADLPNLEGKSGSPGYSSRVQAVVDLWGAMELSAMWTHTPETIQGITQLVGTSPHTHPDLLRRASPMTYLHKDAPPFLIVHGEQDKLVPVEQSDMLYHALQDAGVQATFLRIPEEGHDFGGTRLAEVEQIMLTFFSQHLHL